MSDKQSKKARSGQRKPMFIRGFAFVTIIAIMSLIAFFVWLSLVLTLVQRLQPSNSNSGLQKITQEWQSVPDSTKLLNQKPMDLSQDIQPKACHSHNDYWRRVPLYDALSVGCTGVEADIWLPEDSPSAELFVGHSKSSLTSDRTLSTLYIKPLTDMLEYRNLSVSSASLGGIFDVNRNATVTLLLDFKSNGTELWPLVQENLAPLRRNGWLRHWNATLKATVPGPVTIVATGNAPFDLITANETYRDIFYDAPLDQITSSLYNATNSYYASASMSKAIGGAPWFGRFSVKQMQTLTMQIAAAAEKGLLSRYWDTPSWPVSVRDTVWSTLVKSGTGMLNVDALEAAARWNWDWCVVAGLTLCG